MAEGEDGRRHTANLEGVLRFCVENTKTEDAPEELRQAMDDSRGVDTEHGPLPDFTRVHGNPVTDDESVVETEDESEKRRYEGVSIVEGEGTAEGDRQGEADMSDTASIADSISIAESLPDIEAARRNQDLALATLGLYRYKIPGDGNCMFRAVASQLNLDQDKYHPLLRQVAVKWMREHVDELIGASLLDSIKDVDDMVAIDSWPHQAALAALSNVLGMNMAVIQGGDKGSIDIQHITPLEPDEEDQAGIKLAYLYNGHYDSVVNEPNISNPTYTLWAAQFMKDSSCMSPDIQRQNSKEPYMPFAEYKSPWHRKEKVLEGDPRSRTNTPDTLESSDSNVTSEAEELNEVVYKFVPLPNQSFSCEVPEPAEEHFSPSCVNGADSRRPAEGGEECQRSSVYLVVQREERASRSDTPSVSDTEVAMNLASGSEMAPRAHADRVSTSACFVDPMAENRSEIYVAEPPRVITSPPLLQSPVSSRIWEGGPSHHAYTTHVGQPHLLASGNARLQELFDKAQGPTLQTSQLSVNMSNALSKSPTMRVSPIQVTEPQPEQVQFRCETPRPHCRADSPSVTLEPNSQGAVPYVKLERGRAIIKGLAPSSGVRITMPKEDFLQGISDLRNIRVESQDTSSPKFAFTRTHPVTSCSNANGSGHPAYSFTSSVNRAPSAGSYPHTPGHSATGMGQTGATFPSMHKQDVNVTVGTPIHIRIPTLSVESTGIRRDPHVTSTSHYQPQHVDFSRSTQTNFKMSPVLVCPVPADSQGHFNLERFLNPLRRDLDSEYIKSLLKQEHWFR